MKLKVMILSLILCLTLTNLKAGKGPISMREIDGSIVYLKLQKEMMGQTLTIEDNQGNVIITQTIEHKRIFVDFDQIEGVYTIKISNRNDIQMIVKYSSNNASSDSSQNDGGVSHEIIVTQVL